LDRIRRFLIDVKEIGDAAGIFGERRIVPAVLL